MLSTLQFLNSVVNHPLNAHRKTASVVQWLRWHVGSRIVPGTAVVRFVDQAKLLIEPGMRGATENIYTGLYDFEDMTFLLHCLKADDLFIDIGANVGSYTVLASAVRGAQSITIEPIPSTFTHLVNNINLNGIYNLVNAHNVGVGSELGTLKFTASLDCINHVATEAEIATGEAIEVKVVTLDSLVHDRQPTLLKIDVEGFEANVIAGGKETLMKDSVLGVIMELNNSGNRYGYRDDDIHATMTNYGFATFNYDPFRRKLTPSEGKNSQVRNTLYLRNLAAVEQRLSTAPAVAVNGLHL